MDLPTGNERGVAMEHGGNPHDESAASADLDAAGALPPVTRRMFVKTTAAAAAAGASAWAVAQHANAGASETLKVGLIGCGGRGTGAAAQALAADEGAVLWAMGDMFSDRLETSHTNLRNHAGDRIQAAEERRFVGPDAYQRVLESGIDVVLLASPPHFRPKHLQAAVEKGVHIFCEKPMAVDAPGVRSVLHSAAAAERKGVSLVSGFCWRYSPAERATYQRVLDGAIGDIRSIHTTYHTSPVWTKERESGWSDMEFQLRNWPHFVWLSGDHIVEQACHSIDKINWGMGGRMPSRCTALGGRLMREGETSGNVWDHFTVIYEYEDGARCFHTCRQMPHCSNDNTDYLMGSKGTCYVNGWGPTHVIKGESEWRYDGPRRNMYQVEHDELFASIRSGEPMNDGTFMANSTMLAIMGRLAAYSGQTITWNQAMTSTEKLGPASLDDADFRPAPVAKPGEYAVM